MRAALAGLALASLRQESEVPADGALPNQTWHQLRVDAGAYVAAFADPRANFTPARVRSSGQWSQGPLNVALRPAPVHRVELGQGNVSSIHASTFYAAGYTPAVSLLDVADYPLQLPAFTLELRGLEFTVGEGWSEREADDPDREFDVLDMAFLRDHKTPASWRRSLALAPRLFARKRVEILLFGGVLLTLFAVAVWMLRDTLTVYDGALVLVYFTVCITSDATTVLMTNLYGVQAGYSKLALVALVEFVKLFLSLGFAGLEGTEERGALRLPDVLWTGCSAALYAANNFMFFTVLERLDPMIFAIVRETSILWLCLIYSVIFQRGLGTARWTFASLTVLACMVVHVPSLRARHFDPTVFTALLLTCTSCAAAVVNEKALKLNRARSINMQNALLYATCGFLTLVAGLAVNGASFGWHFFDGFERWTVWVVGCQACLGLVASRILKNPRLGSTAKAVLTAFRPFILLFAVPVFMPNATYSVLAIAAGTVASLASFGYIAQGPITQPADVDDTSERLSSEADKSKPAVVIASIFTCFGAACGAVILGVGMHRALLAKQLGP